MIGENLRGVGEYARSVAFLERCVTLRRAALGTEHAETLNAQHSLAVAYKAAGQPEKAIALYKQVRDSWVKTLGTDHPDTLAALANLAAAYQSAGNIRQAIALFEQVRDAEAKTLGADHPKRLVTLNDLGLAYTAAGMLPKAVELFEHVRGVRVKTLGAEHPDTVGTVNNLALAYRAAGRLTQAVDLFEQVRDGWVKTLGTEHPDTLTALNNLALAYHDAGKLPEAIALFEQVRDAHMKNLGPDHPNTLGTLNNLAMSYKDAGKLTCGHGPAGAGQGRAVEDPGSPTTPTRSRHSTIWRGYQAAGNCRRPSPSTKRYGTGGDHAWCGPSRHACHARQSGLAYQVRREVRQASRSSSKQRPASKSGSFNLSMRGGSCPRRLRLSPPRISSTRPNAGGGSGWLSSGSKKDPHLLPTPASWPRWGRTFFNSKNGPTPSQSCASPGTFARKRKPTTGGHSTRCQCWAEHFSARRITVLIRTAWGSTTLRSDCHRDRPSDRAAASWLWLTANRPARKTSET